MISFSIEKRELKTDKESQKPKDVSEAIEWSIAKWKFIAEHADEIEVDGGPDTCGLCKFFSNEKGDRQLCQLCPVCIKTGNFSCLSTPYEEWTAIVDEDPSTEELREIIALKEVAFLESVQEKMDLEK